MKRRLRPSGNPCHGHNPLHRHHLLPPGRRLLAGTPTPPQPGSRQSRRTGIHLLAAPHCRRHRVHTNLHPTGYRLHALSGACRHIANRLGCPRDGIPPANPATLRLRYRHTPAAAVRPPSVRCPANRPPARPKLKRPLPQPLYPHGRGKKGVPGSKRWRRAGFVANGLPNRPGASGGIWSVASRTAAVRDTETPRPAMQPTGRGSYGGVPRRTMAEADGHSDHCKA